MLAFMAAKAKTARPRLLEITKRLAASNRSVRQALNCYLGLRFAKQNANCLVAVLRYNHLINQHVVAVLDVVNANLRIFSDFRSFDHFSI